MPYVDQAKIRELQASMGSNFTELFEYFTEDMHSYREQLISAFESNRLDDGRRIAHTVKSTSLLFGGSEMAEQAKDLEDAFVSGDRLPEKLSVLRDSMARYVEQLKAVLASN